MNIDSQFPKVEILMIIDSAKEIEKGDIGTLKQIVANYNKEE